jgi:hypothetical protein
MMITSGTARNGAMLKGNHSNFPNIPAKDNALTTITHMTSIPTATLINLLCCVMENVVLGSVNLNSRINR